jgi:hypothetical protein
MKNPTLYLVILMWLWQLQQCFFEKSDLDPARDWSKYRWYYGTGSGFVPERSTLSNINMSTVNSETRIPATDVSSSKSNKDRTDVITSLEEWAARLLKPEITDLLKVSKADNNTKIRFQCTKTPTNFMPTDTDYTTTSNNDCDQKRTYNCLLARNSDKTSNELLLNISSAIKML